MYGNGTVLFEPLLDDDMFELTQAQCQDKIRACIYHFERLLGTHILGNTREFGFS